MRTSNVKLKLLSVAFLFLSLFASPTSSSAQTPTDQLAAPSVLSTEALAKVEASREGMASVLSSLQSLLGTLQQQLFSLLQTTNYRLQTGNQLAQISGSGSGLVAHYTFDEGSGTTAGDSSVNGNTGTLTPPAGGGPTWQMTFQKLW